MNYSGLRSIVALARQILHDPLASSSDFYIANRTTSTSKAHFFNQTDQYSQ
jgi:hypothetical protein